MLHLIQGDDDYRIAVERDRLVSSFTMEGGVAIERFDGKDSSTTLNSLFEAAYTQSFFEPKKVLIVDDASEMFNREKSYLARKDGYKVLDDILKAGDEVLVVLTSHEKSIPKNSNIYKKIAEKGKVTEVKKFWHDPNEGLTGSLLNFVKSEVAKRKLKFTERQIKFIVTRAGSDLRQIANELDKISVYLDGDAGTQVDGKTLNKLIPPSRELIIFNLMDSIAQKERERSIVFLHELISSGAGESYIITMIHRQLKNILKSNVLVKDNYTPQQIAKELELTDFTWRKLQPLLNKFPLKNLPYIISALIVADEEIKTSQLPGYLILEKLIIRLTRE
jgi:DNA polymerase-3 subunit delta